MKAVEFHSDFRGKGHFSKLLLVCDVEVVSLRSSSLHQSQPPHWNHQDKLCHSLTIHPLLIICILMICVHILVLNLNGYIHHIQECEALFMQAY